MKSSSLGFGAGVIAGLIKLFIDQISYALNISNVDTSGAISQMFFNGADKPETITWGIYILITGLVGLLLFNIIPRSATANYIISGIITGVILWFIMNLILTISRISSPAWAMGSSSLVINLISHIVFGIIITYAIYKTKVEVAD